MTKWTPKNTLIVAGIAALAIYYLKGRAVEGAKAAGNAINPLNNDNIFNQYFVGGYQDLTGSEGTPGGDFYDWKSHPDRWWN